MLTISVAMTTYNGEKYLKTQMDSIVPQLGPEDELIISDDGSTDGTLEILRTYLSDPRIRLISGPGKGVVKNFENALIETRNDIIVFADQDDYWLPNKLRVIRKCFEKHPDCYLLLHDMYEASNQDIEKKTFSKTSFQIRRRRHGVLYNLLFSGYYGCCMAFSYRLKEVLLPFPEDVALYDPWIALVAEKMRCARFLNLPLIAHRRHPEQYSQKKNFSEKVKIRLNIWRAYRKTLPRLTLK